MDPSTGAIETISYIEEVIGKIDVTISNNMPAFNHTFHMMVTFKRNSNIQWTQDSA